MWVDWGLWEVFENRAFTTPQLTARLVVEPPPDRTGGLLDSAIPAAGAWQGSAMSVTRQARSVPRLRTAANVVDARFRSCCPKVPSTLDGEQRLPVFVVAGSAAKTFRLTLLCRRTYLTTHFPPQNSRFPDYLSPEDWMSRRQLFATKS